MGLLTPKRYLDKHFTTRRLKMPLSKPSRPAPPAPRLKPAWHFWRSAPTNTQVEGFLMGKCWIERWILWHGFEKMILKKIRKNAGQLTILHTNHSRLNREISWRWHSKMLVVRPTFVKIASMNNRRLMRRVWGTMASKSLRKLCETMINIMAKKFMVW